ncbi:MAG: hypothetical protein KKA73_12470 [Chloroflexi bacterium]|nr:hypothetical protein [Chloroflexota bacterium]MBU1748497.1 hypothetical protein [Chloroflexota bacterium]
MNAPPFEIGHYRPIYLWAGPGTIRMNKLKFMDVAVDEAVHHEAHARAGADCVVDAMRCNWVHLMYDWGFPPEIEQEDWDSFEQAARVYHDKGSPVFAYIQTSNCVYQGSFRDKVWYARDPSGNKITYFTYGGRYMACFDHPEWRQHLKELIRGAIERGADGIFLDNLFQGDQPLSVLGTWSGFVGCHCPVCQQRYRDEFGEPIPVGIRPGDPALARYLHWRADQVTRLMRDMAAYARELRPGIPISANDFDPILRNSYFVYGIDLAALAQVQDVTMIENYGLPRWDDGPPPMLVNNALSIHTAQAMIGGAAHLSMLSYDVGIGFDPVYPVRRYRQGIAEAAAGGASMTTKGTEYYDGTRMTLLTAREYAPIQAALGEFHVWLETHAGLFAADRQNAAPVALLYPGEALWLDWHRLAPVYFGAGQALTVAGIPWRVVRPGDPLDGLRSVLVFDEAGRQALAGAPVQAIMVPELAGWALPSLRLVARSDLARSIVTPLVRLALKTYSEVKLARWAMDAVGLQKVVTQSPLYRIPAERMRRALVDALPPDVTPRVVSPAPALIEVWQAPAARQVHLVNYADQPQIVQVRFPAPVVARAVSPDSPDDTVYQGELLEIPLDVYKVLLIDQDAGARGV